MKKFASKLLGSFFAVVFFMGLVAGPASANEKETAVKLVKSAVAYINANGAEKALDVLNDPKGEFVKGELYVFAYDMAGIMMANSFKQSLIGQSVIDVPDSAGKKFRREIIELAKTKGSGWVDYKSQNPKTKQIEEKTTYFEKVGDLVLGCGVFK